MPPCHLPLLPLETGASLHRGLLLWTACLPLYHLGYRLLSCHACHREDSLGHTCYSWRDHIETLTIHFFLLPLRLGYIGGLFTSLPTLPFCWGCTGFLHWDFFLWEDYSPIQVLGLPTWEFCSPALGLLLLLSLTTSICIESH